LPKSGQKTLYKVRYWGWDGQSRDFDPFTYDPLESLITVFVYSFWDDKEHILKGLSSLGHATFEDKIESVEMANEDELAAFDSGWGSAHHRANSSYGFSEV
jgi:hypothetical protein